MQLAIAAVLTSEEVATVTAALAGARFVDGRETAGWAARAVKHNQQAAASDRSLDRVRDLMRERILGNELFTLAAHPKTVSPILFSRYHPGMRYGSHVDDALMRGMRTDVSFTLFLSDPESYAGGELVIETTGGEEAVKLAAGSLFLYPATTLHRVAEVTSGERLVAIGWAQSLVRDAGRRELLFDLETARRTMFTAKGKTREFDLVSKSIANLLRMWAEN